MADRDINISEPYFSLIRDGLKTIEGRKMSPTWITLKVGDILRVITTFGEQAPFFVEIIKINYYGGDDPLTTYLLCEGLNQIVPGITTLSGGIGAYLEHMKLEEINHFGMMAIHLKVLLI
jgi:ASC-1-like (ASCH) protein